MTDIVASLSDTNNLQSNNFQSQPVIQEEVHNAERVITIEQNQDPLNEFEENDRLLYSAFPHLFPLGKGLRKTGSVPEKDIHHMDNQWHGKFAKCLRFQFLLFDQFQRHAASRATNARVKSNEESMLAFSKMVSDPSFVEKLEEANKQPDAPESKKLLAKLTPHISLVSQKIPYSTASRKSAVGRLINMVRYYGPPSIFNTFALNDVHGLLNIRMTINMQNNWTFPATEDGFAQALRDQQETFHNIPVHPSALRILLSEGPTFAATMYFKVSTAIFTHLFGTPPDGTGKKKSVPLPDRKKGVFGTPVAAFGCTEEQARGSLHMHSLFWGGLTPCVLQAAGGIPGLVHQLSEAINNVVLAHLKPLVHFRHLIRDHFHKDQPAHASLFKSHHPVIEKEQFIEDFQRTADLCNVHQHTSSCFKTKIGKRCCRFGRPVRLRATTGCEQIIACKEDLSKPDISFQVLDAIQPPAKVVSSYRNFSRVPVAVRDNRMIMYYLKRPQLVLPVVTSTTNTEKKGEHVYLPENDQQLFNDLSQEDQIKISKLMMNRNGLVVDYNPVQSAVLGCNTNASILGSDAQAKAALCYLLKYVTKPPAELAHSLSLLHHARRTIELYPSKAKDSGSTIRTGIHYLNKIVNKLCGAIEISAPMAAAAIQGMPAEMCSESFWVAYVTAAVNYALDHPEATAVKNTEQIEEFKDIDENDCKIDCAEEHIDKHEDSDFDEDADSDGVNDDNEIISNDFFSQKEPVIFHQEEQNCQGQNSDETVVSTAEIYNSNNKIFAVPQHIHYAYRGSELAMFSLYEYVALVDVIPKQKKKDSKTSTIKSHTAVGRKPNSTFPFAIAHPLYGNIRYNS